MAFRALGFDGVWRAFLDGGFRKAVNDHVQRRYRSEADRGQATDAVMRHPFVQYDRAACAEDDYRRRRANRCQARLRGLLRRLAADEIQKTGLEGLGGEPELTVQRLSDRPVQMLDLSDDLLLLRVERHPPGTRLAEQYWLYSEPARTLRLLKASTLAEPELGETRVYRDGAWRAPDASLEDDFWQTVRRVFVEEAEGRLRRLVRPREDRLLEPPSDVWAACAAITGLDHEARGRREREDRERTFRERYGPPPSAHPPGIYWDVDAGIRLGITPVRQGDGPPTAS